MLALVEWLKSLETVKSAIPCAVRINQRTYYGAAYHSSFHDEWVFYLLGDKPKHKRTVYRPSAAKSEPDWYIAAWANWKTARDNESSHPFGPWFMIKAWRDGQVIDFYDELEGKPPYKRVMIEVK